MGDKEVVTALNRLVRVCRDGEAGFRVASENIRNRGLKTLLKSYAQQRAHFAAELQAEVERLGGAFRQKGSFLAGVHRGWISIKAAMTISPQGAEQVVLSESRRGERVAVKNYRRALAQSMSPETEELVVRQYETVQEVYDQVDRMRGRSGKRMVIRLFNEEEEVQRAIEELHSHGFSDEAISKVAVSETISVYGGEGGGSTLGESAGAGALGGTIIGLLIGLVAGLGALIVPTMDLGMDVAFPGTLVGAIVIGAGAGAVIGTVMGALIGLGISEEDTYLYADSIAHGTVLLCVETSSKQAEEASNIMLQVNAARVS